MDWDVDMDGVADGFAPLEAGVTRHLDSADTAASVEADRSVDSTILVSTKVHIRGLNSLTTDSIKSYVRDHYGPAERVEWIDDESANLVFSCESSAQEALRSLSAIEIADVTQLPLLESVPAKALASHPEVKLQIRFSVLSDKKAPGAAQRSRFYLLHPEFDPEERRRRNDPRSRYRERAEESRNCLHERIRHTRERSPENYHAGMYDDDESTSTQRVAEAVGQNSKITKTFDESLVSTHSGSLLGTHKTILTMRPVLDRNADVELSEQFRVAREKQNWPTGPIKPGRLSVDAERKAKIEEKNLPTEHQYTKLYSAALESSY
ncbi:Uncharacterized protein CTRI78_v012203 [Colletotrichum trifolii]|uniref:Uncharacterized protein n=1 Tax=Colletotrichum trifolii TaxID=5466 RepID=A0A4V3HQG3_COLTR|nr:Uncharacterized protein CTRI78_v012203 [Colletotrichum trifolii]